MGQNFVGLDVSGAKSLGQNVGAERRGAGRHWGRTSLGQYPWGSRSVGQEVLGQEVGNRLELGVRVQEIRFS